MPHPDPKRYFRPESEQRPLPDEVEEAIACIIRKALASLPEMNTVLETVERDGTIRVWQWDGESWVAQSDPPVTIQ
jgi:hypothetical protein